MKLLSVLSFVAVLCGGVAVSAGSGSVSIPPEGCYPASFDKVDNVSGGFFQTATDPTEKNGEKDGGYHGCNPGHHITSFSSQTSGGRIVGLNCGCSDDSTFAVSTTDDNYASQNVDAKVQNGQETLGIVKRSEGYNKLNFFTKPNGDYTVGLSGITIQLSFLEILIGIVGSIPSNSCACRSGYVLSGFEYFFANYCTKIKFYCCPAPVSSSSTGAPGTGGIQVSSLPNPVLASSSTASTGITGDPQFIGFLGQSFQVHGMDSTVYNIISTSKLQFNAFFTYLDKGECREGTLCFSHPGNYFGKVGVSVKSADGKVTELLVSAGPVKEGMSVAVDGQEVLPSQKHLEIDSESKIYFPNAFDLYVETSEFSLKFENSDMFLNQQVSINSPLAQQIAAFKSAKAASAELMPHGILGQTWQRVEYNNRWKFIEGQLYDYIVADGLKGKTFKYNRF